MTFPGVHRETLVGCTPIQQRGRWSGFALFRFGPGLIKAVWVLGGLKRLGEQLHPL